MKNNIITIIRNLIADLVYLLAELQLPCYITLIRWLVKLDQEILVRYID